MAIQPKHAARRRRRTSPIGKWSVLLNGRKTSISLEDAFWSALKEIAASKNSQISDLVSIIDKERQHINLSSAVRLFILDHYRS
jgi:predicted DNA-binding ribbon-helix-helix protein